MKTKFKKAIEILEEMIHYKGTITYQKDSKFIPISINNIKRMNVFHSTDEYLFVWKDSSGFVFLHEDLVGAKDGSDILPVMVVALRDSGIGNLKQAHKLRIRENFAGENITTLWYISYVTKVAPIVCDKEHLQGGFTLWKKFIKLATNDSSFQIKMVDLKNPTEVLIDNVTTAIPESELWSVYPDKEKEDVVLVLGKTGFTL